MDADTFTNKTNNIYKDITADVETSFYTIIVRKKVIGLMKNNLGGKRMKEVASIRAKHTAI